MITKLNATEIKKEAGFDELLPLLKNTGDEVAIMKIFNKLNEVIEEVNKR